MNERTPTENALIALMVAKQGVMSANWEKQDDRFRETLDALNALHDYILSHRRLADLADLVWASPPCE